MKKKISSLRQILQISRSLIFAAGGLSLALNLSACQKSRQPSLGFSDTRDLLTISDYDGREFDLLTQETLKSSSSKGALKIQDQRKAAAQNHFDFVKYQAKDALNLTDSTQTLGKPNFNYKLKYVFTANNIKVMKVGNPADFSKDELPSAEKLSDGRMMVPICSYNVAFFALDQARNDLNEKTTKLELVAKPNKDGASHFRIDRTSKVIPTFLQKVTVFPVSLFQGGEPEKSDWYYSMTVFGNNYKEDKDWLNIRISSDNFGRLGSKVRFKKEKDRLTFYNLGVDSRLLQKINKDSENQSEVISIPAKYIDFAMAPPGTPSHAVVDEVEDNDRPWDQRDYVGLKLEETHIPFLKQTPGEIVDIQIDDGYFSFAVKYQNLKGDDLMGVIRYSFYDVKTFKERSKKNGASDYVPRVYFSDDQKIFGFFSTDLDKVGTSEQRLALTKEQNTLMNRFNPTLKTIEYRLNEGATELSETYAIEAVARWNQALAAAGIGFRLNLPTDSTGHVLRAQPGDIRYNMLNIYEKVTENVPYIGVASGTEDSQTGEIISSTANIVLDDTRSGIYQMLETQIYDILRSRQGWFDKNYISGLNAILRPELGVEHSGFVGAPEVTTPTKSPMSSSSATGFRFLMPEIKSADPTTVVGRAMKWDDQFNSNKFARSFSNRLLAEQSFDLNNKSLEEVISRECPNLKGLPSDPLVQKAARDCSIKIAKPYAVAVLVHEMGHSLGLRHNFMGSTDSKNYYSTAEVEFPSFKMKTQWKSSSVMDYPNSDSNLMQSPGLYDIAALRFGYADYVESSNGSLRKMDETKSMTSQMKGDLKAYAYCSDEQVDETPDDPLCERWDGGSTPTEIVRNYIHLFNSSMATDNVKLDKASLASSARLASWRHKVVVLPLLKYYEKWRLILAAQAGPGHESLQDYFDEQRYNDLIKQVLDPSVVGKEQAANNLEYKKSADMIFDFLTQILFMPDLSCIVEREGRMDAVSFEPLQNILYQSSGKTAQSCLDSEVVSYLKKTKDMKVISQSGYPFFDLSIDRSVKNGVSQDPEYAGVHLDRFMALYSLTVGSRLLVESSRLAYVPRFTDEYAYNKKLMAKITERLTQGVALKDFPNLKGETLNKAGAPLFAKVFQNERPLLQVLVYYLKASNRWEWKDWISNKRSEPFQVVPMQAMDPSEDDKKCFEYYGSPLCAADINSFAYSLIAAMEPLQDMRESALISSEAVAQFNKLIDDAHFPAVGQGEKATFTSVFKIFDDLEALEKKAEIKPIKTQLDSLRNYCFEAEATIWLGSTGAIRKQISEDPNLSTIDRKAKLDKIKENTILDMAKRADFPNPKYYTDSKGNPFKPFTGLDVDQLKQRVQDRLHEKSDYAKDPSEIDAQLDVLMSSLTN